MINTFGGLQDATMWGHWPKPGGMHLINHTQVLTRIRTAT